LELTFSIRRAEIIGLNTVELSGVKLAGSEIEVEDIDLASIERCSKCNRGANSSSKEDGEEREYDQELGDRRGSHVGAKVLIVGESLVRFLVLRS